MVSAPKRLECSLWNKRIPAWESNASSRTSCIVSFYLILFLLYYTTPPRWWRGTKLNRNIQIIVFKTQDWKLIWRHTHIHNTYTLAAGWSKTILLHTCITALFAWNLNMTCFSSLSVGILATISFTLFWNPYTEDLFERQLAV